MPTRKEKIALQDLQREKIANATSTSELESIRAESKKLGLERAINKRLKDLQKQEEKILKEGESASKNLSKEDSGLSGEDMAKLKEGITSAKAESAQVVIDAGQKIEKLKEKKRTSIESDNDLIKNSAIQKIEIVDELQNKLDEKKKLEQEAKNLQNKTPQNAKVRSATKTETPNTTSKAYNDMDKAERKAYQDDLIKQTQAAKAKVDEMRKGNIGNIKDTKVKKNKFDKKADKKEDKKEALLKINMPDRPALNIYGGETFYVGVKNRDKNKYKVIGVTMEGGERVLQAENLNEPGKIENFSRDRVGELYFDVTADRKKQLDEFEKKNENTKEQEPNKKITKENKSKNTEEKTPETIRLERLRQIEKELREDWEKNNGPMVTKLSDEEIEKGKEWAKRVGGTYGTTRLTEEASEFIFDHQGKGKNSMKEQALRILAERYPEYAEKPKIESTDVVPENKTVENIDDKFAPLFDHKIDSVKQNLEDKYKKIEQTKTEKKEKEPLVIKNEEVKEFISNFGLKQSIPEGFSALSEAQQLKVIQDLQKRMTDIVKTESQNKYDAYTKETYKNAFTRFLGKTFAKGWDMQALEKRTLAELYKTQKGKETLRQNLEIAVKNASGKEMLISEIDNKAHVYYFSTEETKNWTIEEKQTLDQFDIAVNKFQNIPYEWSQGKGSNKKAYEQAKAEYENAREAVLDIKSTKETKKGQAMIDIAKIDSVVKLEQLLTKDQDFQKEFAKLGESPTITEWARRFWQNRFGSKIGLTHAGLTAGGFFTRKGLQAAALTGSMSVLGVVAAPITGAVIGGIRGRMRGQTKVEEGREKSRYGINDETNKERNVVDATALNKRLEKQLELVNKAEGDDKERRIDELKRRIAYTQERMEAGMVNFGGTKELYKNNFTLVENLNNALVITTAETKSNREDIEERLEGLLRMRTGKINEAENKYINKKMLQGAALGAGAAAFGQTLRWAGEQFGWWGNNLNAPKVPKEFIKDPDGNLIEKPPFWQDDVPPGAEKIPALHETEVNFSSRGAIQSIKDLKEKLLEEYGGDLSKAPANVQEFIKGNATAQSIELGLYDPTNPSGAESAMQWKGSTFRMDETGNLILHDVQTDQDMVLMRGDSDGVGGLDEIEKYKGKMFDWDHSAEATKNIGGEGIAPESPLAREAIEPISPLADQGISPVSPLNNAPGVDPNAYVRDPNLIGDKGWNGYSSEEVTGYQQGQAITNRPEIPRIPPGIKEELFYKLNSAEVIEYQQAYNNNLTKLLNDEKTLEIWRSLKDSKLNTASRVMDLDRTKIQEEGTRKIYDFLHMLKDKTPINPKNDTIVDYVKKSMQWAVKNGKVDRVLLKDSFASKAAEAVNPEFFK